MRKKVALLTAAAIGLGFASPFIALVGRGFEPAMVDGIFYAWFFAVPVAVDQLVWPETDAGMLSLAIVVYTMQYLALFAVLVGATPGARFLRDFIAAPRHRRSGFFAVAIKTSRSRLTRQAQVTEMAAISATVPMQ